jgi:hypothetical protein
MLTRIRIEVEAEDSAAEVVEALDKYEEAVQHVEAGRLRVERGIDALPLDWSKTNAERPGFFNAELGRTVTDEVIEKDKERSGYRGRRVVQLESRGVVGGLRSDHDHSECLGGGSFCVTQSSPGISFAAPDKAAA